MKPVAEYWQSNTCLTRFLLRMLKKKKKRYLVAIALQLCFRICH